MAKTTTVQIRLVSSADTGYFYVTKKNARAQTNNWWASVLQGSSTNDTPLRDAEGLSAAIASITAL